MYTTNSMQHKNMHVTLGWAFVLKQPKYLYVGENTINVIFSGYI